MEKIKTYKEEFPPGTMVRVVAGPGEGTDHEFNGRRGTVVDFHGSIAVELDKPPRYGHQPGADLPTQFT